MSLSAPTDTAKKAMEELGLQVFDANGKLRPLNETFQDLNGKLKEMTNKEKINVLNTLFNKVDLKSVNALLANSGERFDELSGYIRDSAGAAQDMADTMNDNLKGKLTILGSTLEGVGIQIYEALQQPLKEAAETAIKSVDSVSYSLKNGKLSESIQTVARAIGNIVSKVAELAINTLPKLIDGFAFLVDHAKLLGTVLVSVTGAVGAFKAVMLFNDIKKSWSAAATAARMFEAGITTSLTGMQAAVGVATKNISLLNAATAALGGPMGMAALAIAGVTAGLIALSLATDEESKKMKELKESSEETTKELENRKAAWQEVQEKSREQISLNSAEIDSTKDMIDELQTLVDENGKVGESKERVKYITDKINELAPDSIKWVDDETIAYEKEADAIKKALDQKEAAMMIDNLKDDKSEAQKKIQESIDTQIKYREIIEETQQKISEAYEKMDEASKQQNDNQLQYWTNQKNELEKFLADTKENYDKSVEEFQDYAETIDSINKAEEAFANEKYDEVKRVTTDMLLLYKDVGTATADELQKQKDELQEKYNALSSALSQHWSEEGERLLKDVKTRLDETDKEINDRAETLNKSLEESGINAVFGLSNGLQNHSAIQQVINSATNLANLALAALNKGLEEKSPSKATERSGKYYDEGLAIGIEKNKSSVVDSIKDLADTSLEAAKEKTEDYKEIGSLFIDNYKSGIKQSFDSATEILEKGISEQTELYKKAIDQQTEVRTEKIEEQLSNLKEAYSDSEKELKEQIKKTKSKSKKEELEQQIKDNKKIYEQQKKDIEKGLNLIKQGGKEQAAAQKEAFQALGKAGKEAINAAYNQIEKEVKNRIDAVTNEFQSQKDEILSLQQSLYSKTSEYGELFHYDEETGELILNDLEKNTQAANDYYDALERLKNQGISQDFVKMIATEYDVEEGTKLLDELLKMSDERLQSYVEEWEKLQEISTNRSQAFLSNELSVIDTEYNKAMESTMEGIKQYSEETLQSFWNEFLSKIPEEYAEAVQIDPTMIDKLIQQTEARLYGDTEEMTQKGLVVPITAEVEDFAEKVSEQTPDVQEASSELIMAVAEQLDDDKKEVTQTTDDIAKDSIRTMERHEGDFENIGEMYINALILGMQNKWDVAVEAAREIAESLKAELEEVAGFSDDVGSISHMVAEAEPAQINRLYQSMLDSVAIQQSRMAASATSVVNNAYSTTQNTNLGDINFNIAEVKGNDVQNSVTKLMEQAEFFRKQRNLGVGMRG